MTLGLVGAPLAGLYGAAVTLRRAAYDRGLLSIAPPPVFTISVGGLEAGGSGKTPVTQLLLSAFSANGRRPGLLTRGYGRATRGLVLRRTGEPVDPHQIGDEPAMMVMAGHDVPVAACEKRRLGAHALAQLGCDVLVMDDGFAHRAQGRHVDLVVLRGEQPLGSGHLLPWGSLREPPSSLARADVIWLHGRGPDAVEVPASLQRWAPRAQWVVSVAVPGPVTDRRSQVVQLNGTRVVAACGIAHPDRFVASLGDLGGEVVETVAFADHHAYGHEDVKRLGRLAAASRAEAVAVTRKDAIKLESIWRGPPLWTVASRVSVRSGAEALAQRLGVQLAPDFWTAGR